MTMSTVNAIQAPELFYLTEPSFSPALVTRSDRDLVAVQRIRRHGDIRHLAVLLESGAIFAIPPQDRVRLLAKQGRLALVQVREGEHRERTGWVRWCDLHSAPELDVPEPARSDAPGSASRPTHEHEWLVASR